MTPVSALSDLAVPALGKGSRVAIAAPHVVIECGGQHGLRPRGPALLSIAASVHAMVYDQEELVIAEEEKYIR